MSKRKAMLVVDSKKHPSHINMVNVFQQELIDECDFYVVDMADGRPWHEIFYSIRDTAKDFVITLDCAGFELRTELDALSYNNLPCRMAHILLNPAVGFKTQLQSQMNFSMFLYVRDEEDMQQIRQLNQDIANIDTFLGKKEDIVAWYQKFAEAAML